MEHLIEHYIEHYGYAVLVLGTFLEGETVLIIGGFLARRGYLELQWVIVAAFIGSYAADQLLFHLGRRHGRAIMARWPRWAARTDKALDLLHRHHLPVVLGFRFLYGLRTVTPFAIGMSGVGPLRFLLLNGLSAAAWACTFASVGYLFGSVAHAWLGDLKRYELVLMALLAGTGALGWLIAWLYHRLR